MPDPSRILLIRPSALGDVVRSVPVLASLKRRFPAARVDWLVNAPYAEAIAHHPDLGRVVAFDRKGLGRSLRQGAAGPTLGFLRGLRAEGYDLVVDAQGLARSGLFAWATRARTRVGHADARELGWLGYTRRVRTGGDLHSVDRMLALLEGVGVPAVRDMRLYPPPAEVERFAGDARFAGRRVAVVAPTSAWPGKRWSAERFAALTDRLLEMGVETVAAVGAPGEREQCGPMLERAARDARVVDLIGQTGVGGLMACIACASLVVANDSAALHMAVGLGRPMVALFGPTDVRRVGPYGGAGDVIQHRRAGERLDHKDAEAGGAMMARISVDEVAEACAARLAGGARSPSGAPGPR